MVSLRGGPYNRTGAARPEIAFTRAPAPFEDD